MINVHVSVKSAVRAIKFIVGILARVFVRNSMCLKSIVNSFVIAYDETSWNTSSCICEKQYVFKKYSEQFRNCI